MIANFVRHFDLRQCLHAHVLLTREFGIFSFIENIAFVIDNRNIIRLQALNAVTYKIDNAFDLALFKFYVRIEHEHD